MCRGHVKTYTTKRPLFGKVEGSFYFSPHMRGDEHRGILLKDYVYSGGSKKGSNGKGAAVTPPLSKKRKAWLRRAFDKVLSVFRKRDR